MAEEVIEKIVEEVVVTPAVVIEKLPKQIEATGRFCAKSFGKEVGIYNPLGKLVGKENDIDKAKDMAARLSRQVGIKG